MRTRFLFILVVILSSCASVEDHYLYSLRKLPEEILHPVSSVSLEKYDVKSPTDIFYHHGSFVILDSHSEYCFNVLDLEHETKTGIIRKGRGPREAIAYSISFCEDEPFLYDMGSAACVRVNIDSSIASSRPILDTISVLHNNRGTPAPLQIAGEFFLSPYPYESGAWYVLRNREGKVLSKLRAPSYPVLSEMNTNVYYSFIMSSFCTFNPHNSKMCAVSVNSPTISFSDIMKTELHEYKRYEYDEPIISEGGDAFSRLSKRAFSRPVSDDAYVYLLYSGIPFSGSDDNLPAYEDHHLIVYDWEGVPRRHIVLSEHICAMCVNGHTLYGVTSYPECKIIKYDLSER